jgi:hypothetical protein
MIMLSLMLGLLGTTCGTAALLEALPGWTQWIGLGLGVAAVVAAVCTRPDEEGEPTIMYAPALVLFGLIPVAMVLVGWWALGALALVLAVGSLMPF